MKSCYNCPDRVVEPNCHMDCKDYIARTEENNHINHIRSIETAINAYEVPKLMKNAIAKAAR